MACCNGCATGMKSCASGCGNGAEEQVTQPILAGQPFSGGPQGFIPSQGFTLYEGFVASELQEQHARIPRRMIEFY